MDLREGKEFYESQDEYLGVYFSDSVLTDIESLAIIAGVHASCFGCFRKLATKFPYGIYYMKPKHEVQVVGVLDLRRDPVWLKKQIHGRLS
ncbi:MAG: hypothetical protein ACI8QI_002473 [Limisphaerales bacterium]